VQTEVGCIDKLEQEYEVDVQGDYEKAMAGATEGGIGESGGRREALGSPD